MNVKKIRKKEGLKKRRTWGCWIEESMYRELRSISKQYDISQSEIARFAINDFINHVKRKQTLKKMVIG